MSNLASSYTGKRLFRQVMSVVLLLALAIAVTWGINILFTLRQIKVEGDQVQLDVDKDRLEKNILFLQTGKLEEELLAAYPLIGSVTFSKSFPSTLVVHVKLRQAYAYLVSQSHVYRIDREGIVIADGDRGGALPRMTYDVGIRSIGSKITDPRVVGTLQFLTALPEGIVVESFTEKDSASIQATMGHTNIFLPQKGDFKDKAGTLQTIVMGFRIKGTLPIVIDLRFDKPIITN